MAEDGIERDFRIVESLGRPRFSQLRQSSAITWLTGCFAKPMVSAGPCMRQGLRHGGPATWQGSFITSGVIDASRYILEV